VGFLAPIAAAAIAFAPHYFHVLTGFLIFALTDAWRLYKLRSNLARNKKLR
jgi:hypothetical protein